MYGRFFGVHPEANGRDFPFGDVADAGDGLLGLAADFGHGAFRFVEQPAGIGGHFVAEEQVVVEFHGGRCPGLGRETVAFRELD